MVLSVAFICFSECFQSAIVYFVKLVSFLFTNLYFFLYLYHFSKVNKTIKAHWQISWCLLPGWVSPEESILCKVTMATGPQLTTGTCPTYILGSQWNHTYPTIISSYYIVQGLWGEWWIFQCSGACCKAALLVESFRETWWPSG